MLALLSRRCTNVRSSFSSGRNRTRLLLDINFSRKVVLFGYFLETRLFKQSCFKKRWVHKRHSNVYQLGHYSDQNVNKRKQIKNKKPAHGRFVVKSSLLAGLICCVTLLRQRISVEKCLTVFQL